MSRRGGVQNRHEGLPRGLGVAHAPAKLKGGAQSALQKVQAALLLSHDPPRMRERER